LAKPKVKNKWPWCLWAFVVESQPIDLWTRRERMSTNQGVIQLLCDLIALPSANPERDVHRTAAPHGEGRVADYVQHYFQPFDVQIERQEVLPGRDNVLVHVPGANRSALPLLLEAHMDTVDVQGMDDPFSPRVESGRVYGRGACDTKASLAAMMRALQELLEEGVSLPRGCVLAATADEEFAMAGARQLVASGMDYAAAIVGEPTALKIVAAHDGQMYVNVTAQGRAAHTSNPQHGVNAIYIVNEVINVLRKRADSEYPRRRHPLCGPPKLTVSIIRGGTSEHIVPDVCRIAIDCRVIPGEACQGMLDELQSWLAEGLARGSHERITFAVPHKTAPPVETPADHPLVRGLREAAADVVGDDEVVGVAYNTNASHYAPAGVPCVIFGPGDIAQAHSVTEYVEIEQLAAGVEILKRFVREGGEVLD
jgi:acetylornithine deacetylase